MTVGERVKLLRERKGMTQAELANQLGYKTKSSVTHIECGRDIPRSLVVRLAQVLDTTPAFLMGWENEKAPDDVRSVIIDKINSLPEDKLDRLLGYLEALE